MGGHGPVRRASLSLVTAGAQMQFDPPTMNSDLPISGEFTPPMPYFRGTGWTHLGGSLPLITCPDCHQPVSSRAASGPKCGRPIRDRSHLSPMGQVVVGGLVLIAGLAWPPLFGILLFIVFGRLIRGLARPGNRGTVIAGVVLVIVACGLSYAAPSYAVLFLAAGLGGCVWLVCTRLVAANSHRSKPCESTAV